MYTLIKQKNKDFIILNLADIQLGDGEWAEGHKNKEILTATVNELVARTKPDLITLSGDQSWAGNTDAYIKLGEFIDSFKVPWTFVWGNHDQQHGYEFIDSIVDKYSRFSNLLFENGPKELGRGNFALGICSRSEPICALILMDTHDRRPYTDEQGVTRDEWASLYPEQFVFYEKTAKELMAKGYKESAVITHIPIFAYRKASESAFKEGVDKAGVSPEESYAGGCWNKGYESSFGVEYEGICSYPEDDGFFELMLSLGFTTNYICGHDHVNCSSIEYKGIRLTYALKTGAGCYWNPKLNGGTLLRITDNGIKEIKHEFVAI